MASILFYQIGILCIIMGVGFLAAKFKILTPEVSKGMGSILINITNPCLTFISFQMKLSKELESQIFTAIVVSFILVIIAIIVSATLTIKVPAGKREVIRFGSSFPNCGFMGIPLISAVFGALGVIFISMFNIAFNFFVWTYGDIMLSGEKSLNKKILLKKLTLSPPLIATYLGLIFLLFQIPLSDFANDTLNMIGSSTGFISMLILGEKIYRIDFKSALKDKYLYYGLFITLIVVPLVSMIFLKTFVSDEFMAEVLFVTMAMPAAVMTTVLSDYHKREPSFASELTVLSHLLCVVTIPLLYKLM